MRTYQGSIGILGKLRNLETVGPATFTATLLGMLALWLAHNENFLVNPKCLVGIIKGHIKPLLG